MCIRTSLLDRLHMTFANYKQLREQQKAHGDMGLAPHRTPDRTTGTRVATLSTDDL
jgi:hypothetical protein